MFGVLKRLLVGRPIPTFKGHHERLGVLAGLAVLSSDALSSVAYATEEILRVLRGRRRRGVVCHAPIIAVLIALLLAVVALSCGRRSSRIPRGRRLYASPEENLGAWAGLIAASALLIDLHADGQRQHFGGRVGHHVCPSPTSM